MALDPQRWSQAVQAAWNSARELTIEAQHAEIGCVHLAVALAEDTEGILKQVRPIGLSHGAYELLASCPPGQVLLVLQSCSIDRHPLAWFVHSLLTMSSVGVAYCLYI